MYPTNTIHSKDDTCLFGFDPSTGEVLYRDPMTSSNATQPFKRKVDWSVLEQFARYMPNKPYDVLRHIVLKELDSLGNLNKSLRQVCLDIGADYTETKKIFRKFKIDSSMFPVFVGGPYKHKKNESL